MTTDMIPSKPMTRGNRRHLTAKAKARKQRYPSHNRPCDCPSCWNREGKVLANYRLVSLDDAELLDIS